MSSIIPSSGKPKLPSGDVIVALNTTLRRFLGEKANDLMRQCPVMTFANRAYFLNTMGRKGVNDYNVYDDAAWLVDLKAGQVFPYNWNTDPARIGWNPGVNKPFAQLAEGVWPVIRGQHKQQGAAWRQPTEDDILDLKLPLGFGIWTKEDPQFNGEFAVIRTWPDGTEKVDEGYHAINLHWGGHNVTSSWGCQTAPPLPNQWFDFQTRSYALTKAAGQKWMPYVLTNAKLQ